jgi:hypothetical protein
VRRLRVAAASPLAALLLLPALVLARQLSPEGAGLALRLAAATGCVLLPGLYVGWALGRRGAAAAVSWALAALFAALAVTFAVHGSLWLALGLYAGVGAAALPFALRRRLPPPSRTAALVALAGVVLAVVLWHIAGPLDGDALFHLARVRKLLAFSGLHLRTVDEFKDGGLHPGYAFPLWHGLLALVARLAAVDPAQVVRYESAVLTPVAFLVLYESGRALFRAVPAGVAVLAASVAQIGLAPKSGGAFQTLDLPASSGRVILVGAVLAVAFEFVETPSPAAAATLAAAALALVLVHPTYAVFVLIPLGGFALVRALTARWEIRRLAVMLLATAVPAAFVSLWLLPVVRTTVSHNPGPVEVHRALVHYKSQLDVFSAHRYRLDPAVIGRTGAVALAALMLVPLAGLAWRRRWAAFVLGGTLAVIALMVVPALFTRLSNLSSLSQSRRAAGFVPFPFALAGGAAVITRFAGPFVLPIALAAGIVLQVHYPGDFNTVFGGGPALPTWVALFGGAGVIAAAVLIRRRGEDDRTGLLTVLAVCLFCLPVAVHRAFDWKRPAPIGKPLPPALVQAVRTRVPTGAIVFSDLETSYRLAAFAPVYVAAAPPAHVADTKANHPYARRRDVLAFYETGKLAIPRRYRAGYILVDESRKHPRLDLPRVFSGAGYVLYRLRGAG